MKKILSLFDLFLMLSTSMYGINGIIQCGKEKCLSKKEVIVNIVLHFIFCADVLSSIYCCIRLKKNTVQ